MDRNFTQNEWEEFHRDIPIEDLSFYNQLNTLPHTKASLEKEKARTEDGKAKPPLSWLPAKVLEQVANVMLWATVKYDAHSWKKEPTSVEQRVASAMRHLNKWLQYIDHDDESGLHHLDHAICQLMMAKHYVNEGEADGRY